MENNIEVLNLILSEIEKKPNNSIFKFMYEGWKNDLSQRIINDYHLTHESIKTLLRQLQNEGYIDKDFNLLKTGSHSPLNASISSIANIQNTETKKNSNQLPRFSPIHKSPLASIHRGSLADKLGQPKRRTPLRLLILLLLILAVILIIYEALNGDTDVVNSTDAGNSFIKSKLQGLH